MRRGLRSSLSSGPTPPCLALPRPPAGPMGTRVTRPVMGALKAVPASAGALHSASTCPGVAALCVCVGGNCRGIHCGGQAQSCRWQAQGRGGGPPGSLRGPGGGTGCGERRTRGPGEQGAAAQPNREKRGRGNSCFSLAHCAAAPCSSQVRWPALPTAWCTAVGHSPPEGRPGNGVAAGAGTEPTGGWPGEGVAAGASTDAQLP